MEPGSTLVTEAASANERITSGTCGKGFRLVAYVTAAKPTSDSDFGNANIVASGAISVSIPTIPGTAPALSSSPLTGHTGFVDWTVTTDPASNHVDLNVAYSTSSSNGAYVAGIVVLAAVSIAAITVTVLQAKRDSPHLEHTRISQARRHIPL